MNQINREGILIIISGFAGAGKGTIVKNLLSQYEQYALSISMTTRNARPGEEEGKSYFFVSKEKFEETIENGGLLEYANYCDNYYGTPKAYVEQQLNNGKDVILEIEIQGALKIKKMFPTALLLFVMPPSVQELKSRLVGRGTESPEVIDKRMRRAAEEALGIDKYDYIVINDEIDKCVSRTHSIIEAAHAKPERNQLFLEKIRQDLKEMSKGE